MWSICMTSIANAEVRWLQRLENYERALATLERTLTLAAKARLSSPPAQALNCANLITDR